MNKNKGLNTFVATKLSPPTKMERNPFSHFSTVCICINHQTTTKTMLCQLVMNKTLFTDAGCTHLWNEALWVVAASSQQVLDWGQKEGYHCVIVFKVWKRLHKYAKTATSNSFIIIIIIKGKFHVYMEHSRNSFEGSHERPRPRTELRAHDTLVIKPKWSPNPTWIMAGLDCPATTQETPIHMLYEALAGRLLY